MQELKSERETIEKETYGVISDRNLEKKELDKGRRHRNIERRHQDSEEKQFEMRKTRNLLQSVKDKVMKLEDTRSMDYKLGGELKKTINGNGVWDLVEGQVHFKEIDVKKDSSASPYLFQGLPEDLQMQVAGYETAKEIWDSLKARFIGTEDVQQAHSQQTKNQNLKGDSLPDKFVPVVATIEMIVDFKTVKLEEIIRKLKTYEERLKIRKGSEEDNSKKLLFTRQGNDRNYERNYGNDRRGGGNQTLVRGQGRFAQKMMKGLVTSSKKRKRRNDIVIEKGMIFKREVQKTCDSRLRYNTNEENDNDEPDEIKDKEYRKTIKEKNSDILVLKIKTKEVEHAQVKEHDLLQSVQDKMMKLEAIEGMIK
ncbi:hypothetical protein Tco_0733545 [Tanacetum coccineum]